VNNKKIVVILIPMLLISILSGCLGGNKSTEDGTPPSHNSAPMPIINAPEMAYFGETIEFDASGSYDEDGTIETYTWFLGEDLPKEGITVTHTFMLPDDFEPKKCPYIYPVQLDVVDNNGSYSHCIDQITLFPAGYTFYLDSSKLTMEKPSPNQEKIKASYGIFKFHPLQELTYKLPDFVEIYPCTWNATIYIEKPRLTIISRVSLALYNETGEMIAKADSSFRLFNLWKEKTILIRGETVKPEEFKSIKLTVYGFSLRNKIGILYGGEKASQICFDFTT